MKVYDKVKHSEYGKGTIIMLCEPNRYDDCLVEFERENRRLDNGNCMDTDFRGIGKEYCCKYCKFDEIEIIEEDKPTKSIDSEYFYTNDTRYNELIDEIALNRELIIELKKVGK